MISRNMDVSGLPDHAFSHHSLTWWGVLGFIVVESTFFGVLVATYLYGIGRAAEWPPAGVAPPTLLWGTLNAGIMVLSCWPNLRYKRAAERMDGPACRRWLLVAVGFGAAFLAIRALEITALEIRWDDHFYGSIVWAILGFHTLHIVADFTECVVLAFIAWTKPLTPHHFADFSDDAVYWYFVIAMWLPLYGLIYLVPRAL